MSARELIQLRRSTSKHKIGMEVPRGGSSCASCKYLVDRHYCSLAMWVEAPKTSGGGGGDPRLPLPADRWCCDGYEVRGRAVSREWSRENPISGTEAFYVLAGVAVVGTIGYLIWKSAQNSAMAAQHYAAAQSAPQDVQNYLDQQYLTGGPIFAATNLIPSTPDPPPPPGGVPFPTPPTV